MFNFQVKTVAELILKKGNPYNLLAPTYIALYQVLLFYQQILASKILNCYLHGKEQYEILRTVRFLDQSKKLFDMIHKISFPKPGDALKRSSTSNIPSKELNVKEVAEDQKLIDID